MSPIAPVDGRSNSCRDTKMITSSQRTPYVHRRFPTKMHVIRVVSPGGKRPVLAVLRDSKKKGVWSSFTGAFCQMLEYG